MIRGLKKILSWVWKSKTLVIIFIFILVLLVVTSEGISLIIFLGLVILIMAGFYNFYKALEKQKLKNYKEAVKYYERVIKYATVIVAIQRLIRSTDKLNIDIFKVVPSVLSVLKDDKAPQAQQIIESSYTYYEFSEFENAIFNTDIVAATYNGLGNIKATINEEYDEAINNYDKAIARDSKNSIFYNNRGNAKGRLGKYEEAISDYSQAIKLGLKKVTTYNNIGNAKLRLGDYKGAILDFNEAIKLKPKHTAAYNNRGNAKSGLGDYKGAILDYDRAIELDPRYTIAYNNRGVAKGKSGDYEGAISDFDRVIELAPKNTVAYKNREKAVIMYFQSAYNQHCIQDEDSDNKISIDGNFGAQTRKALEVAKSQEALKIVKRVSPDSGSDTDLFSLRLITSKAAWGASPNSECYRAYSKYKDILDKIMEESPQ